ncbi:hypothetical protein OAN61_00475 [bacterium]|nr:hypothetical protein [bacterium]
MSRHFLSIPRRRCGDVELRDRAAQQQHISTLYTTDSSSAALPLRQQQA